MNGMADVRSSKAPLMCVCTVEADLCLAQVDLLHVPILDPHYREWHRPVELDLYCATS